MKARMERLLDQLKKPMSIGFFMTLIMAYFTVLYHTEKIDLTIQDNDHSSIFKFMEFIDNKTLDFRLRMRGPIEAKEKIAILAIDDSSLNQIGRWPWSREIIAEMIDRLMQQGAKTLAFDMVFSEPQADRSTEILETIKSAGSLPPHLQTALTPFMNRLKPDEYMATILNKHREKLIMGAFHEPFLLPLKPYQDICYSEAFQRSEGYSIKNKEEWPPFLFNEYYNNKKNQYVFDATPFGEYFTPLFEKIENEVTEKMIQKEFQKKSVGELTQMELSQITVAKENALREYCLTWLYPKSDRFFSYWETSWPKMLANNPLLANTKLTDELAKFQGYFFQNPMPQTTRWTVDVKVLRDAAAHFGMFTATQDKDGTIRRSTLLYRAGNKQEDIIPSLALQTYLVSHGYQAYLTLNKDHSNALTANDTHQFAVTKLEIKDPETDAVKFSVPVNQKGQLLINYAGPQTMFAHLPASELFHQRPVIKIFQRTQIPGSEKPVMRELLVNREDFIKDRIFIVGATAVGVYDLRVTPFEENYPGVETHANVLANLMSQNFLRSHPQEFLLMVAVVIGLGLLVSLILNYLGAVSSLAFSLFAILGLLLVDKYLLFNNGIIAGTIFPIIEIFLIYVSMTFYKYLTEERKKKYLRETFSKYVSPAIVDEILKDPTNIELGGRKQKMTVFFSDVRGFTTISEKLDPQVLSSVLNEYLTPMTNIVFNNKGTLDKYMGDAVMAFFGAPIFFPDHARYACRCALDSIVKLKELQANFKDRGLPHIDIGIGLNTGDMSVGNMGSDIVRSYTVMGDAVNLGSRLEGINKEYGTRIVISEFTYAEVQSEFTCREIDWVRVKGKLQPIKIYELICEGPSPSDRQVVLELYDAGYRLYREARFNDALRLFEQALEKDPQDSVAELYKERCQEYITEPPPTPWDGVYVMKTK